MLCTASFLFPLVGQMLITQSITSIVDCWDSVEDLSTLKHELEQAGYLLLHEVVGFEKKKMKQMDSGSILFIRAHFRSHPLYQKMHEEALEYAAKKIAAFVDAAKAPKSTFSPRSSAMKLHRAFETLPTPVFCACPYLFSAASWARHRSQPHHQRL